MYDETYRADTNGSFFQSPKSIFSVYNSAIAFFSAILSGILIYVANQIGLDTCERVVLSQDIFVCFYNSIFLCTDSNTTCTTLQEWTRKI